MHSGFGTPMSGTQYNDRTSRRDPDRMDSMSYVSGITGMSNIVEKDDIMRNLASRVIGNTNMKDLEKDVLRDY
jgi:hypothetical protein